MDGEVKAVLDRIRDEDIRQNKRIENLEGEVREVYKSNVQIEKILVTMEGMLKEDARQNDVLVKLCDRVDKLEKAPAESAKKVNSTAVETIIKTVVAAIVGAAIALLTKGGGQ